MRIAKKGVRKMSKAVLAAIGLIALLAASAQIGQWEKANGYPFGQMCNSVFTGWVDTCGENSGNQRRPR